VRYPGGVGGVAGAALVVGELARRPSTTRSDVAFYATADSVAIVVALAIGVAVAMRLYPQDLVSGRGSYLRVARVSGGQHMVGSLTRSGQDAALAVVVCAVVSLLAAQVLLDSRMLPAGKPAWVDLGPTSAVADLVMLAWAVPAAWFVAAMAHVGAASGLSRPVVGFLAPASPLLCGLLLDPFDVDLIEMMLQPSYWTTIVPTGWWSWAGGALSWTAAALAAAAGAVVVGVVRER